jgi:hypothetical protein
MNKKCFVLFLIILISILSLTISQTKLNNTGGITNITYHNNETEADITESFLSFLIPLGTPITVSDTITLILSEPKKSDGNLCKAECSKIDNVLSCKILESICDSIGYDSKVIVNSIETFGYEFENINSLISYISFKTISIEMTCSNFKLSFFLSRGELGNNPYQNLNFSIPIHYKEKKGEAKCILPKTSQYIPCIIDAGDTLFQKDNFIEFETNKPIIITENLNLSMSIEKYKLEDDCGKDTNSSNYLYQFSFIKIINILSLIYFMI